MSNRITIIIMLISIILLIVGTVNGVQIGDFKILSISQLQEKDQTLNNKINEATELTTQKYPANIDKLEETYQKYQVKKQKYEELETFTSNKKENVYETNQFEIGYLWRKLGNYATKRNLSLATEIVKNNTSKDLYNINFTVTGKYTDISQFITDVENDSELYARIYNFKMSSVEKEIEGNKITIVIASFSIRDISLDASTIIQEATNIENNSNKKEQK